MRLFQSNLPVEYYKVHPVQWETMVFINLVQNADNCWTVVNKVKTFCSQKYKEIFLGYEFVFCENTNLLHGVRYAVSHLAT